MAASSEKLARPAAPSDSLMRLGSVRDVVLARVPIEAHRALAQTCKALRRLVYSDDFAKLRRTLGCEVRAHPSIHPSIYLSIYVRKYRSVSHIACFGGVLVS